MGKGGKGTKNNSASERGSFLFPFNLSLSPVAFLAGDFGLLGSF
jgi:hypothetical protein